MHALTLVKMCSCLSTKATLAWNVLSPTNPFTVPPSSSQLLASIGEESPIDTVYRLFPLYDTSTSTAARCYRVSIWLQGDNAWTHCCLCLWGRLSYCAQCWLSVQTCHRMGRKDLKRYNFTTKLACTDSIVTLLLEPTMNIGFSRFVRCSFKSQ